MKIKVIGKAHLRGVSKKSGKAYDFIQVHYNGKARGVEGQAALTLSLDPQDHPMDSVIVGGDYNVEFDNTNMDELFMPGIRHFDIQHLGDFVPEAHSLLLLDEVGMIWDNRDYKTFKPCVRDFFKLQRHYHVKVYMASQTFDVDKKLRDLCDGMYLHSNLARVFTLGKRITRKVVITESTSEAESRISEDLKICPFWEWTLTYIPRWAKFFDSHAIPERPVLEYRLDASSVLEGGDL